MSEQLPLTYLAQAVFAAFVSALLIMMLRRPAERWQLVDVPGGRKRHATPVAVTGGVAITTVNPQAFDVMLMTERNGLFAGHLRLGDIRRAIDGGDQKQGADDEEQSAEDADARDGVRARMKDLRHTRTNTVNVATERRAAQR